MKRAIKIGGIVVLVLLLVITGAGVALVMIVDKPFIEEQMGKALNRQVTVEKIDVSIFSVLSGIEVHNVAISNYMTPEAREKVKDSPVSVDNTFVSLESFVFKVRFGALLSGNVELRELMLYKPVVNIVRGKSGSFNFDDLTAPKALTPEEQAKLAEEKKKALEEAKEKGDTPPFTADDLPVAIEVGKVGMEGGTINVKDLQFNQRFQVYGLNAKVYDIAIDPENLEKKNQVMVDVNFGAKTIGTVRSQSIQSFDVQLAVAGKVAPFDLASRKIDPAITVKVGSTKGELTGLQIYESLKQVEQLEKYMGKLNFLQKSVKWSDAFVTVSYKGGTAALTDGSMTTSDYKLKFDGKTNIYSGMVNLNLSMVLAKKHSDYIKGMIERKADTYIDGAIEKFVKPDMIARVAMRPLLNDDGQVYLKYLVSGTMSSPKTKLVHPQLKPLDELIKDEAKKAGANLEDLAKEQVNRAVDRATEAATDRAKDEGKKQLDRMKKMF